MKVIDADTLMEAINTWPKFGVDERGRIVPWNERYEPYIRLRDAVIAIAGMTKIEPERKKGRWIVYKAPDQYHCGLVKCPFCYEEMIAESDEYNFCPNCGADMKGETQNE